MLAPLRPLEELLRLVDWALAHTQSKSALRLNVLYVDDSPEELAMIELAEAVFGLRYPA